MTTSSATPLLSITNLSKTFPGQKALDGVDLTINPGEVHALIGQNGSGKSTLIKVLAGYHAPDDGADIRFLDAPLASRSGTGSPLRFVHQDLALVSNLNALDNLALGRGYVTDRAGRIRWKAEERAARGVLADFGLKIPLDVPISSLAPVERAAVAIARALQGWSDEPAILVLDEPTRALPQPEVERLFHAVDRIRARGAGVLYVSHRLGEVLDIGDRVTVLRDGRRVATEPVSKMTTDKLVTLIVGGAVENLYTAPPPPGTDTVLRVDHLAGDKLKDLSFELRRGEILGVTGIVGSGQDEVANLLFGAAPRTGGQVELNGADVGDLTPGRAIKKGIGLVPADRPVKGCIPMHSARENMTLPLLKPLTRFGVISRRREDHDIRAWMRRMEVRPPDPERAVAQFSGGNAQKTVLAKWLRTNPSVLLLDEPTQGVDVGAKAAIYALLAEAAANGTALVLCTAEYEDLPEVCDRVLVLGDGHLAAELRGDSLTKQQITVHALRSEIQLAPLPEEVPV